MRAHRYTMDNSPEQQAGQGTKQGRDSAKLRFTCEGSLRVAKDRRCAPCNAGKWARETAGHGCVGDLPAGGGGGGEKA